MREEEASEESQERTTATREEMKNPHQIGEEFAVSSWDLEGLTNIPFQTAVWR
ncbi:MAG: hypothetical protein Q4D55_07045 [Eubacteriales bacterium]|nr:hypothetical protein [Eubacteriales bacterium]